MIKYAEFCTGIGGFTLGIKNSKIENKLVYCNEIDMNCEKTFEANFGKPFDSKDIFEIEPSSLPNFDMMCAGFPCQPFSIAGQTKGFKDSRGIVFFKLLEIIKEKKPSILFFENVPNLFRHNKGKTFNIIEDSLLKENYSIYFKVLDSKYFGVPQSRPRLYIIGLRNDYFPKDCFSFTEKRTSINALKSFINNGDYSIPISEKWQKYIDLYTNKINLEDISFEVPKTRKKLERISNQCDLSNCVFQIRSSGIRAYSIEAPFPTFAVSNSGGGAMIPVLSKERRHLNIIEIKRIMGFPDDFIFPLDVSRTNQIKQLANAVCPPVIESICNDLVLILN